MLPWDFIDTTFPSLACEKIPFLGDEPAPRLSRTIFRNRHPHYLFSKDTHCLSRGAEICATSLARGKLAIRIPPPCSFNATNESHSKSTFRSKKNRDATTSSIEGSHGTILSTQKPEY